MKAIVLLITSLLIISQVTAQDLVLTSENGTKTIEEGTYVYLQLSSSAGQQCEECDIPVMTGQFMRYVGDSLYMRVRSTYRPQFKEGTAVRYSMINYPKTSDLIVPVHKAEVLSITKKGKDKYRSENPFNTIGAVVTLLGVGHLSAAPFIDDKENSNSLIYLGLSEIVAGITLAAAFDRKKIVTHQSCPDYFKGKRLWTIQ